MSKTIRLRLNVVAEDQVTVTQVQDRLRELLEDAGIDILAPPVADGEEQSDLLPKRGPRIFWQTSEVLQGAEREAAPRPRPRAAK